MNKFDIVNKIEKFAPEEIQEKWDCSGWLVCTKKIDIQKIMLALTITDKVYQQAKKEGCDMIVSHHPLFFVPMEYSDIDMYCAHTNMDKADNGTTDTLIKTLGFEPIKTENEFIRIVNLDKEISVSEFKNKLKKISPNLRYINNSNIQTIKTVAFCAGSGSEFIDETSADAFVTGDLKFHKALECKSVVFDIGHFESEIFILDVLKNILNVDNIIFAKESSPFINE